MLDFAIFAICFVTFLLILVFYLYPGSVRQTSIPGLDPSDPKEGNIGDILQAGGLQNFLLSLHKTHGPIASFWMGSQLIVSLGQPELLQKHSSAFDKPVDLFELYKPIIGSRNILFANGIEGRKRRNALEALFSQDHCKEYLVPMQELSREVIDRWSKAQEEDHIPVFQYMFAMCMKSCTKLLFGEYFQDDKNILEFSRSFEVCWVELEEIAGGLITEANSPKQKKFTQAVSHLRKILKEALDKQNSSKKEGKRILIDALSGSDTPEEQTIDDCLTFIVKHYSLVSALTWTLYFLATHGDVQDKVAEEVKSVQKGTSVPPEAFVGLKSIKEVIMETLRTAVVEPWTARYQDVDVEIGGHVIPKQTPVIHALGVVLHSSEIYPSPKRFDLSHVKSFDLSALELKFCPFGFAGKRSCPAKNYVHFQMAIFIGLICSTFKVSLVEGQVVNPTCRLITKPEEEVWVTLKKR